MRNRSLRVASSAQQAQVHRLRTHRRNLHEEGNVWHRKPYGPFFNQQWVDYAFKNVKAVSAVLGESRLAMHQPLLQEAKRLWQLVRRGECAMGQWD